MESNKNISIGNERTSATGSSHTTHSTTSQTGSAPTRAKDEASNLKDRAGEVVEQTKQAVSNAYEQTSQALGNTYDQAMTYSRNNPGTVLMIAFGAGVGIGLLLASGRSTRGRMSRISEPIVSALSAVALEFLR